MAEPEWIQRVNEEATRMGLNLSSLIRMVVTQYLERAESERKPKKR